MIDGLLRLENSLLKNHILSGDENMYRRVFITILACLMLPALALAGTTGKIKGKVTDRETGEPLPAANVIIVGTTLGVAADLNGEFVILNVPAGTYSVKTTYIGYQSITVSNVKVTADLTTEVNFPMPSEAMAVGAVEIIAERPLVNKNATNAVRIATQEDVAKLPLRGVQNYVALSPGVVLQNDNIYIRGGRSDEVGFYVEGANTRNVMSRDGGNEVAIIPEALEEFQVQAGGYNAEYGGANAGIVRQSLRSGTTDYRATLQVETDNFANKYPYEKFLDTYSYGYWDYTGTLSGPLPIFNNKFKFFLAGQNAFEGDRVARFLEGFDINHTSTYIDANNFPVVTTFNEPGKTKPKTFTEGLHFKGGNVPQASRNRYTGNATLIFEQKPFIFRFASALTWQRTQNNINAASINNLFRTRVGKTDLSTGLYNLKMTHLINAKTFYEVNLNYFDRRAKAYDPVFGDSYYSYFDSLANAQAGYIFDSSYLEPGPAWDIAGFNFNRPSVPAGYNKDKRSYYGGSADLTTQYRSHEVKLGASYQRYTVRSFDVNEAGILRQIRTNPDLFRRARAGSKKDLGELRAGAGINTYGYDEFGNEIDSEGLEGPKNPQYFSAYLQDKFEAKDLVVNAGVRLDVIDNDDFVFLNPTDPGRIKDDHTIDPKSIKKKDAFVQASPRLGFAFPVTDRTVFHMQYGKFIQAPALENLFTGINFYDQLFIGGFSFQNPVGVGIDPERTTQYEIGFNQQFADNASFDITAFYKDIKGQLQVARIRTDATSTSSSYNVLVNGDFATTKGLEFSLTLRRTNRVTGQINYTLSNSSGTGSVPNGNISGIELTSALPTVITPLEFNQPHRGSLNFDYRFAKGDGGPILQQMGLNLLLAFTSGHPYTRSAGDFGQQDPQEAGQINDPRSRRPLEALNASLTPWNFNLDMRLDKTLNVGRMDVNIYAYVQNLTNRKNVINVYNRTGNAYDDGFLTNPDLSGPIIADPAHGDRYISLQEKINLANGFNYTRDTGNLLFAPPRQIRLGVRLEY
jgi:outer membrane receptor protein involved in Fe transport